ncbi:MULTISPECIES: LamG-like jellyroll fold domain-containing protein [unclassified Lentimonas]|uniref:LamG-like jellyroll fold domain-containing protein n=1 Tax=unclassified Lentimonas TaxID=2630993 RepID=UPI001329497F|nr:MULTISPECIES: LamG-like jellyroll fold domain-containing protein [unclassified Lentimonas]CAA6692438.1 Unannotated [Lentimonas sp. CC19]CAA6693503.1 Unannotated [Lentimonas sp. CC10]CAA7070811.1 Unannotated [Lentimonas sp. CC11]
MHCNLKTCCCSFGILGVAVSGLSALVIEAEDAVITSADIKADVDASIGFYMDGKEGFNLTWTVNAEGGSEALEFRIKVPSSTRSMGVFVNDSQVGVVSSSSTTWEAQTVSAVLNSGTNTIELRDSEGTAELDVDYLSADSISLVRDGVYLEAESMSLDGYVLESFDEASNGSLARLSAAIGSVETTVSGISDGNYDLGVDYWDESDGVSAFKVFVNDDLVDAWYADRFLGNAGIDASNRIRREIKQVPLESGDVIRIFCAGDGGELGRVDGIELLTPLTPSALYSANWNTDGTLSDLVLAGVEHLDTSNESGMQLRVFDGYAVDERACDDGTSRAMVVDLTDTAIGYAKLTLRTDVYGQHMFVRLVDCVGIPRNDDSINFQLQIPFLTAFNVVALDDEIAVETVDNTLIVDWNALSTRGRLPSGGIALYANGSEQENESALEEIIATHFHLGGSTQGIVAHWSLDEGGGTTALDSSGNEYDATVPAGFWDVGIDGSALRFRGSGDTALIPAAAFSDIDSQISIALWAYGGTTQPAEDSVFYAENETGDRVLNIHLPWGNGKVYWDAGRSNKFDRISKQADEVDYQATWNHWVFTKDAIAGDMKIYLNGSLWHSGTGYTNLISGITEAWLGSSNEPEVRSYDGMLDEVILYNIELSEVEVGLLYGNYILPQDYSAWLLNYAELGDTTFAGDSEQDGIQNGIEYVLNGNPAQVGDTILPELDAAGEHFVFTFKRSAESVPFTSQVFQYGSDLIGWTDLSLESTDAPELVFGSVVEGLQSVTVNLSKDLAVDGKLFGRLKVDQLP